MPWSAAGDGHTPRPDRALLRKPPTGGVSRALSGLRRRYSGCSAVRGGDQRTNQSCKLDIGTRPSAKPLLVWGCSNDLEPPVKAATQQVRATVAELEELGWGSLWSWEVFGREALTNAGLLLSATRRLVVGTGIANIWARDPVAMAAAQRTLAEVSASARPWCCCSSKSHRCWSSPMAAMRAGRPRTSYVHPASGSKWCVRSQIRTRPEERPAWYATSQRDEDGIRSSL